MMATGTTRRQACSPVSESRARYLVQDHHVGSECSSVGSDDARIVHSSAQHPRNRGDGLKLREKSTEKHRKCAPGRNAKLFPRRDPARQASWTRLFPFLEMFCGGEWENTRGRRGEGLSVYRSVTYKYYPWDSTTRSLLPHHSHHARLNRYLYGEVLHPPTGESYRPR